MKEIKNIWWDYTALSTSRVTTIPLTLIYIALITRILGPQLYGVIVLFTSLVRLGHSVGINWSGNAVIRFGKEEILREGHLRQTFSARLTILLLCLLVVLVIMTLFRKTACNYIGISENLFFLIPLMIVTYSISDFISFILRAIGLMKILSLTTIVRGCFLLAFAVMLWFALIPAQPVLVIVAEIVSYGILIAFSLFFIRYKSLLPLHFNWIQVSRILHYSWPLIFSFSIGYFLEWGDIFVIKYYATGKEVGLYQTASVLFLHMSNFLMLFCTLFFPIVVRLRTEKRYDLIRIYLERLTPQITIVWVLLISSILIFSETVFGLIYGPEYRAVSLAFSFLLVGLGFVVLSVMATSVLEAFDFIKLVMIINLFSAILKLTGGILLVPRLGINGAAIATAFATVISSTVYVLMTCNVMSMPGRQAIVFPLVLFPVLMVHIITENMFLRGIVLMVVIGLSIILARKLNIFRIDDHALVDKIDMPNIFKQKIKWLYGLLSN